MIFVLKKAASILLTMNRKFKHLEFSALLDQLAQNTAMYTKLLHENGTSEEKENCRQTIHRLLAELTIREREGESSDPANRIIR